MPNTTSPPLASHWISSSWLFPLPAHAPLRAMDAPFECATHAFPYVRPLHPQTGLYSRVQARAVSQTIVLICIIERLQTTSRRPALPGFSHQV
jgi:hypothetical protein